MSSTTVDLSQVPYGYIPGTYVAYSMLFAFGSILVIHLFLSIRHRTWFLLPTVAMCVSLELVGWGARLWSHHKPTLYLPYITQLATLILGPTHLLGAIYIIFGRVVQILGPKYSRLNPTRYSFIFTVCDTLSALLQMTGGMLASRRNANPDLGSRIMLIGFSIQLATLLAFSICAIEFSYRYSRDVPVNSSKDFHRGHFSKGIKFTNLALAVAMLCLTIRLVYRLVALAGGWNSKAMHQEMLFNIFDGAMVIQAMVMFIMVHPGKNLRSEDVPSVNTQLPLADSNQRRNHV